MRILLATAFALPALAACNTVPDPVPGPMAIDIDPLRTCMPVSALTRVYVPEKTKTFTAITEIDNPPYEPIQQTQKVTRVVEEAKTIFVDSQGREITDICDMKVNPGGMVSER
ncbi:hypothetical protein [uncultured Algimonas sp.]|uniref:hypothetical protein n=1 Tax=uncultured Algimonas sp. TaxID=1547920 RepID=UPI002637F5EA|nr:hypothetical protein [uncultured Algimonas sp.]